ncbi:UNVERIFIED_CONTAM: hypothetical protein K2H54_035839 [Gekko kuhli]
MNEGYRPSVLKEEASNQPCHPASKFREISCDSQCFSSALKGSEEQHRPRLAPGNLPKQNGISSDTRKGSYDACCITGSEPCNDGPEDDGVESKVQPRLEKEGGQDVCNRCSDGLGLDGKCGSCPELNLDETEQSTKLSSGTECKPTCGTDDDHADANANGSLVGVNGQRFHLSEDDSQDLSSDSNGGGNKRDLDRDSSQGFCPGLEGDPSLPVKMTAKEDLNPEVDADPREINEAMDVNENSDSEMDRDNSGLQLEGSGGDRELEEAAVEGAAILVMKNKMAASAGDETLGGTLIVKEASVVDHGE